ncbi:MAG: sugar phosphate isomerase/epimerase, partial [Clostridia bacterium]|nr:sugar phosphate isomerase/epimerase [Clostridia bacterium]
SGMFFNGVHISFGTYWDFSDLDENKRKDAVKRTVDIFSECDPYKPNCYIMHGSFEPIEIKDRKPKIVKLVESLKEMKSKTKTTICLENLPRSCIGNTSEETIDIVDKAGVKICVDVNHFLSEKPEDAILKMGKRIYTTHISDYDFIDERHWLPGAGKINWKKVIASFEKIGYSGVLNMECGRYSYEERINSLNSILKR